MKKILSTALAAALVLLSVGIASSANPSDEAAIKAAEAWLKLVDDGQYGASWDEASELFKKAVKKPDWEKAVAGVRSPLGQVKTRTLKASKATKKVPGAPEGDYVVIQFDTVLEKKTVVETITPMLDNGKWRVSGYFVK